MCPSENVEEREVIELYGFFRELQACKTVRETSELIGRKSDCGTAFDIFADQDGRMRDALEARLLAGDDAETIAEKMGISKAAVESYAAYFFDVTERLDCTDFIHSQVLDARGDVPARQDRGRLLKLIAYKAGADVLNLILNTCQRPAGEVDPTQHFCWAIDSLLNEKTIAAVQQMDVSSEQVVRVLMQSFAQQQAARAESGASSSGYETFLQNVEVCLKQIPWSVASRFDPPDGPDWLPPEAELRADDQLRLAHGLPIDKESYVRATRVRETEQFEQEDVKSDRRQLGKKARAAMQRGNAQREGQSK
jgi:hypothetical protein